MVNTRLVALPASREQAEQAVLRLTGELDLDSEAVLAAAMTELLESGRRWIVLDCSQLTFCDSRGMNSLLGAQQRARAVGGGIALAAVGGHVGHVLALTGVDQAITTAASVDACFDLIAPSPAGTTPEQPDATA
ncbi:STAS domain-containing protein [Streptomyces syringium]|uniref:STAS domain-containing protein n=1 Tax=Streptomyces syringium TaxID=76729 RepID=UPI0033D14282